MHIQLLILLENSSQHNFSVVGFEEHNTQSHFIF